MSTTPEALTKKQIMKTIQEACSNMTALQLRWTFAESLPPSMCQADNDALTSTRLRDEANFYGIVARDKSLSANTESSDDSPLNFTTFYLAYSTWDGRVLFRDFTGGTERSTTSTNVESDQQDTLTLTILWYHLLAKVAVGLGCNRLVWLHYGQGPTFQSVQPEPLPAWLSLHWNLPEMQQFTKDHEVQQPTSVNSSLRERFTLALQKQQALAQSGSSFLLRLATAADLDHITRLVHGLATFENEPESVKVTPEELAVDGFEGDFPLFYCVLLDYVEDNVAHTCGMAFCYIGYKYESGRFLYLEDLFLEEVYRGKGGGTLLMGALALAAQMLDCTKMVWQALDWNAPALTFYEKIGAKVQTGLQTCRFKGSALQEFAKLIPNTHGQQY
ncbi:hypothetical protein ACA910_005235 [Epithemia clementina (nom. ined.)]